MVYLRIDSERCTGHGRCYTLAPDLIDSDENGYGVVTVNPVADGLADQAGAAVRNCPESAIELHGGES